jgi:uncharacterized NAD-dependent epimerase/dehydratase family protein
VSLAPRPPYLIYFADESDRIYAKTGLGIIEWRRELCIGQFRRTSDAVDGDLPDLGFDEAVAAGAKSLVIGTAPMGGIIPEHWNGDLAAAARAGLDIVSGMHVRLASLPGLAAAASQAGTRLVDLRNPPSQIPIATGRKRSGKRLLTVGTDCAIGKKYSALAIEREMRRRGWAADFRSTGQTGILISGSGIAIDSVVADFVAGAAELLSPDAADDHWDVVEGQGSLVHPSYSGISLALLHGTQPDALVLCHNPSRTHIAGLDPNDRNVIPPVEDVIELNLMLARRVNADARFVGICINTSKLPEAERAAVLRNYSARTGLPAVDPLIEGAEKIVDLIEMELL